MSIDPINDVLKDWRVLVIDAAPDAIDVASILLEMCGASVVTACNGQEGLDAVKTHKPHFVLSDLSMPVMTGWEMLETLKQNRATMDLPVIALTAHAMPGDRDRAIAAGFHNYLTKPLLPETFVNDLLKLLIAIPEMALKLNDRIERA
jgi:two-component system, cell cycle response regulator DivK